MKTRQMMVLAVLLGLLASQEAQAFYNPATGRWLSRDPIGEKVGLDAALQGKGYLKRARLLQESRQPEYVFAENGAVSLADADGRSIPIIIGTGVGVLCLDIAACWAQVRLDLLLARSTGQADAPDGSRHHVQGSLADALTHCNAGCEASRHPLACITAARALAYLNGRENPAVAASAMDMANNTVGYSLAINPQNKDKACRTLCLEALMNNGLFSFNATGAIPLIYTEPRN